MRGAAAVALCLAALPAISCKSADPSASSTDLSQMPTEQACVALFRRSVECKDEHWVAERAELARRGLSEAQIERQHGQYEEYLRQPADAACHNVRPDRIGMAADCYAEKDCTAFVDCMVKQGAKM